jgi:hypothetical protein
MTAPAPDTPPSRARREIPVIEHEELDIDAADIDEQPDIVEPKPNCM